MSRLDPTSDHLARRGFLARLSTAAAGAAAFLAGSGRLGGAQSPPTGTGGDDPDAWIARMTGRDRVLVHAHQHLLPAVVAARNLLANARDAYGVPERENSIAVATHGPAIAGLFRDEIWERFTFGELYKLTDSATGKPLTRNPYLAPQEGAPPDAVVPELMRRGVTFLACNVAVRNLSRRIVRAGESPEPLHAELVAGLVPGVVVVPDLFVAIAHAQQRRVGYIFID
jgi:intracellular sulfur oxidation DsrE/DsrF family protein